MEEQLVDEVERERSSRKFVKYTFFKVAREWRFLKERAKNNARSEFLAALKKHSSSVETKTYSLVGVRGDVDFMIWARSPELDSLQTLAADLNATKLGKYLQTTYSYLAMSKRSRYLGSHRHEGQEGSGEERSFGNSKFLFVYPFVKKREWYRLPFAERQRMMAEHFKVGHRYPRIKINTGYSFGIDDQEFVLAFEGDSPSEFLDLVEELRGTDASAYTALETPIFTCRAVEPERMLSLIG